MTTRLTSLSKNIIQFCRFLRLKGFSAGVEEEATVLQALQQIDYSSNRLFVLALKSVLCRNKTQSDQFDGLFHEYWMQQKESVEAKEKAGTGKKQQPPSPQAQFKSLKTWLQGNKNNGIEETATCSTVENLSQKNFSSVPEDEIEEMMQHIKKLSKRLAAKVNRRYEYSDKINLPDLRRTLRKNLRRGGELLEIVHRKPKRNRVKLLVLCDISKSMELYTAFLLQFLYAFHQVYNRVETFVFSTSLKRITPLIKQENFQGMLDNLEVDKNDWNGGTKIGSSLESLVNGYGQQVLTARTIVIILSDGWDAGSGELLEKNMKIIAAKSKKLIWLNPLAGYTAYRPEVAGMKIAMPYIDLFAPVHNAESLRMLSKWL